ncbi:hypothetical protein QUB00_30055 [Microcoleus sp. F8_C2]
MTQNGWCRTNYHKDGKRRFGKLTNGFCCECEADGAFAPRKLRPEPDDQSKITRLEQKIADLEQEGRRLDSEIKRLRSKLQTLIKSLQKSGVSGVTKS